LCPAFAGFCQKISAYRVGCMLIVGGVSAFAAIGVFFLWRLIVTCRSLWRKRQRRAVAREKPAEKMGVD